MAKKIRGVKLKNSDINKNNGKEISHTINKIKEHEMRYTIILVVIFMFAILFLLYLGINVDSYDFSGLYDSPPPITSSSDIISLNNSSILSDEEGLNTDEYLVQFSNNTSENINYVIRIINDEKSILDCDCGELIVPYDKIRYSINSSDVKTFEDGDMIIKTGMIEGKKKENISIKFWLDGDVNKDYKNYFFGRVILEQIEDMDKED